MPRKRPGRPAKEREERILQIIITFAAAAGALCDYLKPVLRDKTEPIKIAVMLLPAICLSFAVFKKSDRRAPKRGLPRRRANKNGYKLDL